MASIGMEGPDGLSSLFPIQPHVKREGIVEIVQCNVA